MAERIFCENDFKLVSRREGRLSRESFQRYKDMSLGKPVPPQTASTEELLALGYDPRDPWVQCLLERTLFNW
jgi:hypothetical protein